MRSVKQGIKWQSSSVNAGDLSMLHLAITIEERTGIALLNVERSTTGEAQKPATLGRNNVPVVALYSYRNFALATSADMAR